MTLSGFLRSGRELSRLAEWPRQLRWWTIAVAVGAIYSLPLLTIPVLSTAQSDFASVLFYPVGIYVLLAIGLNIVVGKTGLIHVGYAGFFAVGGYAMGLAGVKLGMSYYIVTPLAAIVGALVGVLLGFITLRLRDDYLAIVTLGFGEVIRETVHNLGFFGGARGVANIPHPGNIGSVKFGFLDARPYVWLLFTIIGLVLIILRLATDSRVGRAWNAVRDDEDAAEFMGVPTFRFKLLALVVSSAIGAVAGTTYAAKVGFIAPDNFVLILSILILAAVIIGGSGNTAGVIAAAVLIAYLPERFRAFSDYRVLCFALLVILVMIYRPQGLAGLHGARISGRDLQDSEDRASAIDKDFEFLDPAASKYVGEGSKKDLLLAAQAVSVQFGGIQALSDVSFEVRRGEIVGLVGPNGAGKTTLFNVVSGAYRPTSGEVLYNGTPLARRKRHQIARAGIARTFQNLRLFGQMTVEENVLVGADARSRSGFVSAVLRLRRQRNEEIDSRKLAQNLMRLVGLDGRGSELASNLSYGEQRRLEIARALAARPELLLLDEPAAGSNATERNEIVWLVEKIRSRGHTVLIIEHDMGMLARLCDRIVVLDFGAKIAEGTPNEVQTNPRVIEAYLGKEVENAS